MAELSTALGSSRAVLNRDSLWYVRVPMRVPMALQLPSSMRSS
jgi:hypothetical protein